MPVFQFSDLPDSARLWTYGAERTLTADEVQALQDCMADFLAQWHSHQQAVAPTWQLLHDRFVVVCVDESMVGLSGCSIDSMFRTFRSSAGRRVSISRAAVTWCSTGTPTGESDAWTVWRSATWASREPSTRTPSSSTPRSPRRVRFAPVAGKARCATPGTWTRSAGSCRRQASSDGGHPCKRL